MQTKQLTNKKYLLVLFFKCFYFFPSEITISSELKKIHEDEENKILFLVFLP